MNYKGINRRRIYDIINVMEALEMISKQSKNWYLWHGRGNLLSTLAKLKVSSITNRYSVFSFIIFFCFLLKAMSADDPDIRPYLEGACTDKDKENVVKKESTCPKDEAVPSSEVSTDVTGISFT